MRVLLDECVPRPLKRFLQGHAVRTVTEMGWKGAQNGDLLSRIRAAAFDVLVTVDQNLPYQQNLQAAGVSIIVLRAAGTRLQDLEPLMPALCDRLLTITPGQLLRIER